MKPRRTHRSNAVFRLNGGTEDNDLWAMRSTVDGEPTVASVWELTDDERAAIAGGANIMLVVWGQVTPPVSLCATTEPLGRPEAA